MFCDVKYCVVLLKKHAHFLVIGQGFKLCFSECFDFLYGKTVSLFGGFSKKYFVRCCESSFGLFL